MFSIIAASTTSAKRSASVGSSAAMKSWRKRSISAGLTPSRMRMPPICRRSNSPISEWYIDISEASALIRTPFR